MIENETLDQQCYPPVVPEKTQSINRPRKPEKTVLFEVIKKHYKTWHKNSEEPIPNYIENEFDKYLGCGILAKGFACAHCDSCHKEFFIAFSCKGRGVCPSCNTKAMVETAANLIENVIPLVPVRQFLISFPKRIRHYLQRHSILQALKSHWNPLEFYHAVVKGLNLQYLTDSVEAVIRKNGLANHYQSESSPHCYDQ